MPFCYSGRRCVMVVRVGWNTTGYSDSRLPWTHPCRGALFTLGSRQQQFWRCGRQGQQGLVHCVHTVTMLPPNVHWHSYSSQPRVLCCSRLKPAPVAVTLRGFVIHGMRVHALSRGRAHTGMCARTAFKHHMLVGIVVSPRDPEPVPPPPL